MKPLLIALVLLLLIPTVAVAGPNREALHLNKHQGGYGPGLPQGLPYCYDEDDFEEWWYLGWMQPGQTLTASLRFCDGQKAGDWAEGIGWMTNGNTMFFLSVSGRGQYAINFIGSSPTDDLDYPLYAADTSTRQSYELWKSCHPDPGAWVVFTVTNLSSRAVDTSLRFGSAHYTNTGYCP